MTKKKSSSSTRSLVRLALEVSTQDQFFEHLGGDLSEYSELSFTEEEIAKIDRYMKKVSTGSASSLPMICFGPACPFASTCPLQQIGKAPIGKSCLIEAQLLKDWTIKFMKEYDVDPNSITEVSMCTELAEIELMLHRINLSLSKPENAELVIEQTIAVSRQGDEIRQKMISPFMEEKHLLQNRKSKLIKLMVGDRQEKYKKEAALKQKQEADPSSRQAHLRARLESLNKTMNSLEAPNQSIEGKVLTPEDIIAGE